MNSPLSADKIIHSVSLKLEEEPESMSLFNRRRTLVKAATVDHLDIENDLTNIFEEYERIRQIQNKKVLMAIYYGRNMKIPAMGDLPIMRYIPDRQLM